MRYDLSSNLFVKHVWTTRYLCSCALIKWEARLFRPRLARFPRGENFSSCLATVPSIPSFLRIKTYLCVSKFDVNCAHTAALKFILLGSRTTDIRLVSSLQSSILFLLVSWQLDLHQIEENKNYTLAINGGHCSSGRGINIHKVSYVE